MNRKTFFVPTFAALLSLALCQGSRAELPPAAYASMQAGAPEVVRVQVVKVTTTDRSSEEMDIRSVTVVARVLYVRRTVAGIKKGETITIRYDSETPKTPGWAGPAPIPVVRAGTVYRAYLQGELTKLAPAAKGRSFETIDTPKH